VCAASALGADSVCSPDACLELGDQRGTVTGQAPSQTYAITVHGGFGVSITTGSSLDPNEFSNIAK
jgi:hypothetical protein